MTRPKGSGQQIANNNALASRGNGPFSRSLISPMNFDALKKDRHAGRGDEGLRVLKSRQQIKAIKRPDKNR
jgi:hypothetical protein